MSEHQKDIDRFWLGKVFVETAKKTVKRWGKKLIGKSVFTQEVGNWPGGWAIVTKIKPDAAAPEIVFQVEHPVHGTMGIFGHEKIITEKAAK